ncbi:MAG: chorismate synthase [Desulfobacterota bacterium]|nr:chorismate synthase [Thermodesulfobacteriota bacterium]
MLRFLTSGESHGKYLTATIEGIPSGLKISAETINHDLARRQTGYGVGPRMAIEKDEVEIVAGVRFGKTIGSPITLLISNRDWIHWQETMAVNDPKRPIKELVTAPRPGHADLAGALKYHQKDIRNILERSSARETAARVAVGSICRAFVKQFGIRVIGYVISIGGISIKKQNMPLDMIHQHAEASMLRCPDPVAERSMIRRIDAARKRGDSLGGIFEVVADGVPPGIGSHIQWDLRLDARLAQAIMSIQAIKGVEIGMGFEAARRSGSQVHDPIWYDSNKKSFYRTTNNAGGIEGGISNGEMIVVRAAMKPIATLYAPLHSVDIVTKEEVAAAVERSDICRVPSAAVIGEAMVCIVLANALLEKFGGDNMSETLNNYASYLRYLKRF